MKCPPLVRELEDTSGRVDGPRRGVIGAEGRRHGTFRRQEGRSDSKAKDGG